MNIFFKNKSNPTNEPYNPRLSTAVTLGENDDDDGDEEEIKIQEEFQESKNKRNKSLFFSPYSKNNNINRHEFENGKDIIDANIIPGNNEKNRLLSMFNEMRKESLFCDIIFSSHGKYFRAHKVIVSSWSRWLRALLSETSSEYKSSSTGDIKDVDDIVNLDIFDANAFATVLEYMYGVAIEISIEVNYIIIHLYKTYL